MPALAPPALAPATIAEAYLAACRAELAAIKPGNVHVHAAGHRMSVADFEASAALSAPPLTAPGARVGARIEAAVAATRAGVGQNTNLGIVLLCAPLPPRPSGPGRCATTSVACWPGSTRRMPPASTRRSASPIPAGSAVRRATT